MRETGSGAALDIPPAVALSTWVKSETFSLGRFAYVFLWKPETARHLCAYNFMKRVERRKQ